MTEYQRQWWAKNQHRLREYRKAADLKKKYGLTLDQYNAMYDEQDGLCAVCHQPETQLDHRTNKPYNLSVDHCHKTNKIRQLLCNKCNRVLGVVNDDESWLIKLIQYVEKHKGD